jgi:hypothetical protein
MQFAGFGREVGTLAANLGQFFPLLDGWVFSLDTCCADVQVHGWTPFAISCNRSHRDVAAALLSHGADVNLPLVRLV